MLRTVSLVALSAFFMGAAAVPAMAQDVRQEVVFIGDVDQGSDAGADVIIDRIQDAARDVCGTQGGAMPIPQRNDIRDCRAEATQTAIDDLNNGLVTARYYGLTPEVTVAEDEYVDPDGTVVVKKPA